MSHRREARLGEQLKREISAILSRKVRDPRVGRVLVTEVRVTADLWLARIYVRPLDGGRDVGEVLAGLEAAAPFVRKELAEVLHIRRIPELRFHHDTRMDSALRIEEVLRAVLPDPEVSMEGEGTGGDEEDGREGAGAEGKGHR
jgi:ribosome-binding factor A